MTELSESSSTQPATFDTNAIPLGERSWHAILQHVIEVGDEAETSYLEIKSALDIKGNRGAAHANKRAVAKIAKFLLGAANRSPKDAARHFQGHAVLVIGAEKGQALGVPRGIELHDLENALRPYLGPKFPNFELGRIALGDEREVLLIIAPPPKDGEPIYPCCKNYQPEERRDNLRDGAIYVRGSSSTREARHEEVLALVERSRSRKKPPIDLEVSLDGPIYRVGEIDDTLNRLYDQEEQHFSERIAEQYRRENNTVSRFPFMQPIPFAKPITGNEMEEALRVWKDARPEYISTGRQHLLGVSLDFSRIQVVSHGKFIAKPQLSVHFYGCEILEWNDPDNADLEKLVEPVIHKTDAFGYRIDTGSLSINIPHREPTFGNDPDKAWMAFDTESFRPNTPWHSGSKEHILVARDISSEHIEATWTLTEDGNDEVATGGFTIKTEPPVSASDLVLRNFLEPNFT